MTFHSFKTATARKQHLCEHCLTKIEVGERYHRCAQVFDGDFSAYKQHTECHEAWHELNFNMRGVDTYEGAPFLRDDDHEPDDKAWMRETHPIVAKRLGWAP